MKKSKVWMIWYRKKNKLWIKRIRNLKLKRTNYWNQNSKKKLKFNKLIKTMKNWDSNMTF